MNAAQRTALNEARKAKATQAEDVKVKAAREDIEQAMDACMVTPREALGRKVVAYALHSMALIVATAAAWMCSTAVLAVVIWVLSVIVLTLLAFAANLYVQLTTSSARFEAIGRPVESVGTTLGKALRIFKREPKGTPELAGAAPAAA